MIMMYTGLRTKNACKFAVAPCIKVEPIILYPFRSEVLVANEQMVYRWMSDFEVSALAIADGFKSVEEFFAFFQKTYCAEMLVHFEIVWWDPQRVVVPPGVKFFRARDLIHNPSQWKGRFELKIEAIADWEMWRKR